MWWEDWAEDEDDELVEFLRQGLTDSVALAKVAPYQNGGCPIERPRHDSLLRR
jgi:hypothetical protein